MNIKEARQQIENAVAAYLERNEQGELEIPVEMQRPIFLIGAPGIGKTAIMRQIAEQMGIGLVSYSMTHHTRQSALGLPRLVEKPWGTVTEYTMSEILSSVYEEMDRTGIREGILFLDEINCVSETLAPSMLQFLQFKTFGQHRIPEGWIIVTAGNPPEYNRSVREFDLAMLDRLKVLQVEPDYSAWREYAVSRRMHPAVLGFLDARKDAFYRIENTPLGRQYVTARGWEDLSVMLRIYEKKGLPVDELLAGQYLCSPRIATEFTAYYDLFVKYAESFPVRRILRGEFDNADVDRVRAAAFDERYAMIGLLLDALTEDIQEVHAQRKRQETLLEILKVVKHRSEQGENARAVLDELLETRNKALHLAVPGDTYPQMKAAFAESLDRYRNQVHAAGTSLENTFDFCERAFDGEREILILVTEMTTNPILSEYIARYGCEKYFAHNRDLLFYERKKEIEEKLDRLAHEEL